MREVRENAPAELTATERLMLVWIAEQSREEDRFYRGEEIEARTCFPGRESLMRWCGISSERTFRSVLQRLAERGLDVRVRLFNDTNGNPVYAVRGQRMVLRLPDLRRQSVAATWQPDADKGAAERTEGGSQTPPIHNYPSTHEKHVVDFAPDNPPEPPCVPSNDRTQIDSESDQWSSGWNSYRGQADIPDRDDLWATGS